MAVDGTDHEAHPTEGATNVLPFPHDRRVPPGGPGQMVPARGMGDSPTAASDRPPTASPQKRHLLRPSRPRAARAAGDDSVADALRPGGQRPGAGVSAPATPTAAQLLSWLEGLRRSGVPTVRWNVAVISLERAIARAARLDPAALITVHGYHVFVVELLPNRPSSSAAAPELSPGGLQDTARILP
jgi:hypothetical protein